MIKGFFKWLAGVLAALILLFIIGYVVVLSFSDNEPTIVNNSYLYISLSGVLSEYSAPDPLEEALGKSELDMKKVRDVLEKAAVDERINGVVLQTENLQVGFAKLQELRHLIEIFRQSNKPIYAFLGPDLAFSRDYYVASACDSVYMPPSANLFITGIGSEVTFYKDFFSKIGVQAEFVHVGKYKNAPDTYTRHSMSGPHKEVLDDLLDYMYNDLVQTIAKSRSMKKERAENLINEISGFTGRQAIKAGLVDRCGFIEDFEPQLSHSKRLPTRLDAVDYAAVPASSLKIRNKSRIAVINCVGVISGGEDGQEPYFGKIMGAQTVIRNLRRSAKSKSIKAIILRIDSPGGSATASEAIWHAIHKASEKKPVIASVSDYGASGGYYISMAADTMLVTPGSLTGSIGVFAGKFNIEKLYDKLSINNIHVQRGTNSTLFSVTKPWSASEKKIMQNLIEDFYHDFVQKTADARDMSYKQVDLLAQGRVWTGEEAVRNGLFDTNGFFYSAVDAARKMAHIDSSESVRLVYYPREKSLLNELMNSASILVQNNIVKQLRQYIMQIQNRPLALLPFTISWN